MTTRRIAQASVRAVLADIKDAANDTIRSAVLDSVAYIQSGTPVDTGWLKNNWRVSVGVPTRILIGSRETARAGALAVGAGDLDYIGELLTYDYTTDGDIFIQNAVPYAQVVNAIHRERAGFIEDGVTRALEEHSL